MNKLNKLLIIILLSIVFISLTSVNSLALDDLLGFQANLKNQSNGDPISSADIFIEIWDSSTGGNLIYNSTDDFLGNVTNER